MEKSPNNQTKEAEGLGYPIPEGNKPFNTDNRLLEEENKEESEEKMIQDPQHRRKPGEFRESELLDHNGSLLNVRDNLNVEYGKTFWITADQTNESLEIQSIVSSDALKRIDDEMVGKFLEKFDTELRNNNYRRFKSFTLALQYCYSFTGSGLGKLFQNGGDIELEKLLVSFAESNSVTNEGLSILSSQISSKLKTLKQLRIVFPLQTNDDGLKEFAIKSFPSFQNLQRLEFLINSNNISDHGAKDLAVLISKDLTDLQYLDLNFSWCTEITDNGLRETIIPLVPNLKNLQHLKLDFSTSEKITGTGFGALTIPDVNSIAHLHLNFSECTKFNDDGLKGLGTQFLSRCKGLQRLELKFTECKQIQDNGLVNLVNQISLHLIDLQHLDLIFDGCKKITNQGVQQIADQIQSRLQKLQKLDFFFYNCAKNIKKLKKSLEDKFKGIPTLNIELG